MCRGIFFNIGTPLVFTAFFTCLSDRFSNGWYTSIYVFKRIGWESISRKKDSVKEINFIWKLREGHLKNTHNVKNSWRFCFIPLLNVLTVTLFIKSTRNIFSWKLGSRNGPLYRINFSKQKSRVIGSPEGIWPKGGGKARNWSRKLSEWQFYCTRGVGSVNMY